MIGEAIPSPLPQTAAFMLIDCPSCARSYHVKQDEIGNEGRTLICPRCRSRWFVDGNGRAREELSAVAINARVVSEAPARLKGRRPSVMRSVQPIMALAFFIVGLMGLIGARQHIVRLVPQTARAYALIGLPVNTRGLEFARIETTRTDESGLAVVGEIRNVTQHRVHVPRLTFEIRDAAGADLIRWSEGLPERTLAVGQKLAFAATPHDLPPNAETVLVHFEP